MKKIILLIVCFLFAQLIFGKEFIIKPIKIDNPKIPLNIRFLTSGSMMGRKFLRVSILVEEVYPSIFIEEIIRGNVEGEADKVKGYYLISGFDIAKKFGYTWLIGLKFNKWNSWNEFEMSDTKTRFLIRYNKHKQFQIKAK